MTSASGETVESTDALGFNPSIPSTFALGVQFDDDYGAGAAECVFTPPAAVYDDTWGGIEGVLWQPNPWGGTEIAESGDDCFEGSASCLRVTGMNQWEGAHLYYRQLFPVDTFATLTLQLRGLSGGGELTVAPSSDGERCAETVVSVAPDVWTSVTVDIAADCAALDTLNGVTLSNNSPLFSFIIDDIRFE